MAVKDTNIFIGIFRGWGSFSLQKCKHHLYSVQFHPKKNLACPSCLYFKKWRALQLETDWSFDSYSTTEIINVTSKTYLNLTIHSHSNIISTCDILNLLIGHATVNKRCALRYLLYPRPSRAKADLAFIFKKQIMVSWRISYICVASEIHPQINTVTVLRCVRFQGDIISWKQKSNNCISFFSVMN